MYELLKKDFRDRSFSLFVLCLVIVALLWLYVAIYPSILAATNQLNKLLQSYPKGFLKAFNINQLSFDTLDKFIAVEQFSFTWPIMAIALALSRAGGSLAGEVEKGTMGLYLALPVWRPNIYLAKYLSGFCATAIFGLVSILATLPLAALYHIHTDAIWFVTMSVVGILFMWTIFSVGMLLSAMFSERSRVYMAAIGILIVMYAINIAASLKSSLHWLQKFSVFYFFNSQEVLAQHSVRLSSFLVFGVTIMAATLLGMWVFSRRDISV